MRPYQQILAWTPLRNEWRSTKYKRVDPTHVFFHRISVLVRQARWWYDQHNEKNSFSIRISTGYGYSNSCRQFGYVQPPTQSKQDPQRNVSAFSQKCGASRHQCTTAKFLKRFVLARLDCGSKPHDVLSSCCWWVLGKLKGFMFTLLCNGYRHELDWFDTSACPFFTLIYQTIDTLWRCGWKGKDVKNVISLGGVFFFDHEGIRTGERVLLGNCFHHISLSFPSHHTTKYINTYLPIL